jgi:hypothetical protein
VYNREQRAAANFNAGPFSGLGRNQEPDGTSLFEDL